MKIYIAASYPRKAEALELARKLVNKGHVITSRWIFEDEGYSSNERKETIGEKFIRMQEASKRDLYDVCDSDLLVCLTDGEKQLTHGGRHTEFGIALALKLKIVLIGPRECVFHFHPNIITFRQICDDLWEKLC